MELALKDFIFLGTQVAIVTAVIVTNRVSIQALREQSKDHKEWLKKLQETVVALRVKVGI